jgi:DNA-binding IclR family transcriptional regulator
LAREQRRKQILFGEASVSGPRTNLSEDEAFTTKNVVSVARSFQILEYLVDAEDGRSLADVAKELDVNKSIASKLLDTLADLALIWRDGATQRFYSTYRVSNLGLRQLQTGRLMHLCATVLKTLAENTGELVRLAVVEGGGERLIWIYSVPGKRRALLIDPHYTLQIDYQTHSAGKAWLMTMPFQRAWKILQAQGIRRLTPYSKVTKSELKADFVQGSKQGFIVSIEENEIGVGALAAPVRIVEPNGNSKCVAVVSISAPSNRLSKSDFVSQAPLLLDVVNYLGKVWPDEALIRSGLTSLR